MFAPYYSYDTVHIINKNPHNTKLATDTTVLRNKSKKPFSTYLYYLIVKLQISTRNKYFQ